MGDVPKRMPGKDGDDVGLGKRNWDVYAGGGMAGSRLRIPDATASTAHDINTVAMLVARAGEA